MPLCFVVGDNGLWTHFVIAMDTKHGHTQIIQSLFPMVVATLISVIVHSSIAQQNDDIFATQQCLEPWLYSSDSS